MDARPGVALAEVGYGQTNPGWAPRVGIHVDWNDKIAAVRKPRRACTRLRTNINNAIDRPAPPLHGRNLSPSPLGQSQKGALNSD